MNQFLEGIQGHPSKVRIRTKVSSSGQEELALTTSHSQLSRERQTANEPAAKRTVL
jgi:hypothetical protein